MVTDLVRLSSILDRAEKDKLPEDVILQFKKLGEKILADKEKKRRQPRPPAPQGGITQSEAARKYGIPQETISRWVKAGYIRKLKDDGWVVYIDEARIAHLAKAYHSDPGRGSWAVKKLILQENNS